jgi:predicted GH43/DUF377 family glycosyl hydrolase
MTTTPLRPAGYPSRRVATPHRDGRLLIRPSLVEGAFDSHGVDCPFVFSVDGRQGMTYVGWDGTGYQTALAWRDGDEWSDGAVVLPRDPHDPLRRYNAALTSIVRDNALRAPGELRRFDGWYLGTYHAYPSAGYETGPGAIGFVRSRDLRSWEPVGRPLLPQEGARWERGGLYKSWLLEHDGLFYLFYNAKDVDDFGSTAVPPPWIEQTGLAVSRDLTTWERYGDAPVLPTGGPGDFDERFASDPCVLKDGDFWLMFYFGLAADGHAREGFAWSRDLRSWTKSDEVLLDVGPQGTIDSLHAHKPAVITWDGRLEHYYTAVAPRGAVSIGGVELHETRGIARAVGAPASPGGVPGE